MDKENVLNPCNQMIFSNKKKQVMKTPKTRRTLNGTVSERSQSERLHTV